MNTDFVSDNMLRLRQYKEADAEKIAQWVQDKDTFMKWGGERCRQADRK